jgi:hypothetical protein
MKLALALLLLRLGMGCLELARWHPDSSIFAAITDRYKHKLRPYPSC